MPLKFIQWQPDAGLERLIRRYDLIRRILSTGKSVQVYAQIDEINDLVKHVGSKGLLIICPNVGRVEAEKLIDKYRYEC